MLSGLAIADAQEEQAEEVRGTTGASFTVERNLSTGGWANDSDGTYSTQELITKDMIQKIASVEGITGYDASNGGVPTLYDEEGNNLSPVSYTHLWLCRLQNASPGKPRTHYHADSPG